MIDYERFSNSNFVVLIAKMPFLIKYLPKKLNNLEFKASVIKAQPITILDMESIKYFDKTRPSKEFIESFETFIKINKKCLDYFLAWKTVKKLAKIVMKHYPELFYDLDHKLQQDPDLQKLAGL